MPSARQIAAVLLLPALLAAFAVPVEALACRSVAACPMRAADLPCHGPIATGGTGGGMSAPIDCCSRRAGATSASVPAAAAPPPLAHATEAGTFERAAASAPRDRRASRPAVALHALHAVWRI
jgi:hypothetical protein